MRAIGAMGVLAVVALVQASNGCAPNEEILCSRTAENTAPSCAATYNLCAGGTDRIECKPATGGVSCACIENGVTKSTFASDDACNVTVDTLQMRAAKGCGWKLSADDP